MGKVTPRSLLRAKLKVGNKIILTYAASPIHKTVGLTRKVIRANAKEVIFEIEGAPEGYEFSPLDLSVHDEIRELPDGFEILADSTVLCRYEYVEDAKI